MERSLNSANASMESEFATTNCNAALQHGTTWAISVSINAMYACVADDVREMASGLKKRCTFP